MKKLSIVFFILLVLVVANQANAKVYKIAIIDSGIHYKNMVLSKDYKSKIKLCKTGHKNYIDGSNSIHDNHGHGTHIAGLIAKEIKEVEYCFIIMKVFDRSHGTVYTQAIKDAIAMNVDAINISGGGMGEIKTECRAVKEATKRGIAVVAAAGNGGTKIYKRKYKKTHAYGKQYFFPASCDNNKMIVVGNGQTSKDIAKSSNYGDIVDIYINGNDAYVFGTRMTGTSQSTAIATGKFINQLGRVSPKGVKNGKKTTVGKKSDK